MREGRGKGVCFHPLFPPGTRMREVGLKTGKREARHRDGQKGGHTKVVVGALLIKVEEARTEFSPPGRGECRSELVGEA